MGDVAADRVRDELTEAWRAWAAREQRRGFVLPSFLRAGAVAALLLSLVVITSQAGAESPLYVFRAAMEDALVAVQADPVAYLTDRYNERVEEAARMDAVGNALAASRAREASNVALRLLTQIAPKPGSDQPEPTPEPSRAVITLPSPTPDLPGLSPIPTPIPTPAPPTTVPTSRPLPAETPLSTPTPAASTPKPATPAPSPMSVRFTGDVLYADGMPVDGACVAIGGYTATCIGQTVNGKVDINLQAKKGQSITLYFKKVDALRGGTLKGSVTVTVNGPTILIGTITLKPA
jgi:hypothetical protein